MKDNNFYVVLLTGLLTVSCSNEHTEVDSSLDMISFEAAVESVHTRAGLGVQNTRFDKDEEIAVFIKEQNTSTDAFEQPIVYKATPAEDVTGFYALSDPRKSNGTALAPTDILWTTNRLNIYAYHPKTAVTSLTSANTFTVQANQSTDANYKLSDLMAAERTDVVRQNSRVQLTFYHLLSKVVIKLVGDRSLNINHAGWRDGATVEQQRAAQIEANSRLVGAEVELVGIKPTTTITKPMALGTASGTADIHVGTITTTTELVNADDATSAWQIACIIPPQTIAANTQLIKVTMTDGGVLYYMPSAQCTFTTRLVNTYNITVHAKELTLTGSTIAPWTVGDTEQGHEAQPVITL